MLTGPGMRYTFIADSDLAKPPAPVWEHLLFEAAMAAYLAVV